MSEPEKEPNAIGPPVKRSHRYYQELAHNNYLRARRIATMVESDAFGDIANKAGSDIDEYILTSQLDKLESWILANKSLDHKSMPELRGIARRLEIPYYTKLDRHDLILRIIQEESKNEKS